ncbi:MAG: hypothetical protein K2N13_00235 [Paraprevotella sp.]|nr:hypothetical protein [Paraprevotella sp.]
MKKIIFLLLAALGCSGEMRGQVPPVDAVLGQVRECDLFFQVADVSNAITDVTRGTGGLRIEHVGIYAKRDGKPVIIEAIPERGVCETPLDSFLSRNALPDGTPMVVVGRVGGRLDLRRSLLRARGYLGCGYDSLYLPDNKEIYCSELVQKSFVDTAGCPVFVPVPMSFRDSGGNIPDYWTRFYARHGMPVPEGAPGTNPGELSRRPNVRIVLDLTAAGR